MQGVYLQFASFPTIIDFCYIKRNSKDSTLNSLPSMNRCKKLSQLEIINVFIIFSMNPNKSEKTVNRLKQIWYWWFSLISPILSILYISRIPYISSVQTLFLSPLHRLNKLFLNISQVGMEITFRERVWSSQSPNPRAIAHARCISRLGPNLAGNNPDGSSSRVLTVSPLPQLTLSRSDGGLEDGRPQKRIGKYTWTGQNGNGKLCSHFVFGVERVKKNTNSYQLY
jgi:hypothetical protein